MVLESFDTQAAATCFHFALPAASFTGRLQSAWRFTSMPGPNYDAAAEKLVGSYKRALFRSADHPMFYFSLMIVIYLGIYQSYVDCAKLLFFFTRTSHISVWLHSVVEVYCFSFRCPCWQIRAATAVIIPLWLLWLWLLLSFLLFSPPERNKLFRLSYLSNLWAPFSFQGFFVFLVVLYYFPLLHSGWGLSRFFYTQHVFGSSEDVVYTKPFLYFISDHPEISFPVMKRYYFFLSKTTTFRRE